MKARNILATLLLMVAGLQTATAQKMVVTLNDNSKVTYSISQVKEVSFVEPGEHDYVDLGLPSGTLWATCNVGASKPEEYGDYFAWGETEPKDHYDWSTYFDTDDNGSTFKKYNSNGGLTELLPEDDAATTNWGNDWQMPSLEQIKELYDSGNTTTEWTQLNGVDGFKITSNSNDNSIFLPAAGFRYETGLYDAGVYAIYWARTLHPSINFYAAGLKFYSNDSLSAVGSGRNYGRSIRPVRVN